VAHCARLGGSYFRGVRGRDCHRHAAGMGENEVGELMALRPFVAAGSDTMTFTVCRAKRRNGCGSGHLRPIQEVCIGAWFQAHCCHPVRRKHGLVKAAVDIVIGVDVEQQIHVFVIDRLSQQRESRTQTHTRHPPPLPPKPIQCVVVGPRFVVDYHRTRRHRTWPTNPRPKWETRTLSPSIPSKLPPSEFLDTSSEHLS